MANMATESLLTIVTPYTLEGVASVAQNIGRFRMNVASASMANEHDPTIAQLALPNADPDHRLRMGANLALRYLVDYHSGLSIVTRLGSLLEVESVDTGTITLGLVIRPGNVKREEKGTYVLA